MRKSRKYREHKPDQESYPLAWPSGWARTDSENRQHNRRYRISLHQSIEELFDEIRKMAGDLGYVVLSSNIPVKKNGLPYTSGVINPEDPGVAVYWYDIKTATERVIACDAWVEVRENVRALALAIQALRQLERCKATEILDRAFQGFAALPGHNWWDILGVRRNSNLEEVTAAYRQLSKTSHPDQGGSTSRMVEINQAFEKAKEALD